MLGPLIRNQCLTLPCFGEVTLDSFRRRTLGEVTSDNKATQIRRVSCELCTLKLLTIPSYHNRLIGLLTLLASPILSNWVDSVVRNNPGVSNLTNLLPIAVQIRFVQIKRNKKNYYSTVSIWVLQFHRDLIESPVSHHHKESEYRRHDLPDSHLHNHDLSSMDHAIER